MSFKFEKLEVWQLALDYIDVIYGLANKLPENEKFNLNSQITRAAASLALNIAEGSTGQSNAEQHRSLGMAIRSLIETVACQRIIKRRKYGIEASILEKTDAMAQDLAKRLHAFRRALATTNKTIKEDLAIYETDDI